jgi:drug/metabolite transporter (DMT)-like permease
VSMLQVTLLLGYAIGMSLGQLLFKFAALSISPSVPDAPLEAGGIFHLGLNPYFIGAVSLYFGLSFLWVWILTFTPLSRAYPFVALAFIVTPLASHLLFTEALDLKFYFGLAFIVVGLILVIR